MALPGTQRLLLVLVLLLAPALSSSSGAWDADLELLDLVEEIPRSFYEFLSVDQDAPASEIKKAYRRLSLVLHPDKNKDEDAEMQFRQLVAIYEVLKDEERRKRYDDILVNGLPDWRQPVYYYRRVRKMSNSELGFLLFVILTVGHYAVLWSMYLEKILDELLTRKKREKKKKLSSRTEYETRPGPTQNQDRTQDRPQWQDLLPLKLSIWLYFSLKHLPQTVQELKSFYEEQQLMKKKLREEQEQQQQENHTREKKVKVKKPKEFPVYDFVLDDGLHSAHQHHPHHGDSLHGYEQTTSIEDIEDQMDDWLQERTSKKKVCDWSEEELGLLTRLMVKFPGGTPGRWERIAHELNRTVAEVTTKVKQVKDHVSHTSTGLVKLSELKAPHPHDITQGGGVACEEGDELPLKRRSQAKVKGRRQADFDPTQEEEEHQESPTPWTQSQQRLLEAALQHFPRGTPERWTRIAAAVPGKTKDECIGRYKTLAEMVQKRKQKSS